MFINITSLKVPNPDALKFEVEGVLLTAGAWNFTSKAEALPQSPLAAKLLGLDFVKQVFIHKNFVTVTRHPGSMSDWDEVQVMLRTAIRGHLDAREPVVLADSKAAELKPEYADTLGDQIRKLMDDRVRVATAQDGGDITFESYEDGVVNVKLAGACVGCPYAPRTIKAGIEVLVKQVFPEVTSVTSKQVDWTNTQA